MKDEEKYRVGKAENITIESKLLPETKTDRDAPSRIRLQQMGEDGVLRWSEREPTTPGVGSATGAVTDEDGKRVAGATVHVGDRSVATDAEGRFAFDKVSEAARFVVATKAGFEPTVVGLHVRPGQISTVAARLPADRIPPSLLSVSISGLADTSPAVAGHTNELTTADVTYGPDAEGEQGRRTLATGDEAATAHSVELTDLAPATSYRVRIRCTDVAGNAATSEERAFTTGPVADAAPPEGWGYYSGAGSASWGRTTQEAHTSRFSAFLKATGHSRGSLNIALVVGDSNGYSGANAYAAQRGATYRYSFWLKGDIEGVGLLLMTWHSDRADKDSRDHTNLGALPLTDEWA